MSKLIQTHYDNPAIKLPSTPTPRITYMGKRGVDGAYEITLAINTGVDSDMFDSVYLELWDTTNQNDNIQIAVIRDIGQTLVTATSDTYTDNTEIQLKLEGYYQISKLKKDSTYLVSISISLDTASESLSATEYNVCRNNLPEITTAYSELTSPNFGITTCGKTEDGFYLLKSQAIKQLQDLEYLDHTGFVYMGDVSENPTTHILIIPIYTAHNYGIRQTSELNITLNYINSNNEEVAFSTVLNNLEKAYIIIEGNDIINDIINNNISFDISANYRYKDNTIKSYSVGFILHLI